MSADVVMLDATAQAGHSGAMTDDGAKAHLHQKLRAVREALVWKLDGLSEYDVRRPLTSKALDATRLPTS